MKQARAALKDFAYNLRDYDTRVVASLTSHIANLGASMVAAKYTHLGNDESKATMKRITDEAEQVYVALFEQVSKYLPTAEAGK